MKVSNTSQRLKEIICERDLRQVDILNMAKPFCDKHNIKLTKVDLSQYISGKVEPGQAKLFILAEALNVSEAWLMGLDVPPQSTRNSKWETESYSIEHDLLTLEERVSYYTNFYTTMKILGYNLVYNWKSDSHGNTIDLLENADYEIEIPHYIIKEVMNSSKSFIEYNLKKLFNEYPIKERNKEFDNMSDEEFENYFSEQPDDNTSKSINTLINKKYLEPQAAHERTDIEVTDKMRKHDDDIMDNDDLWK